MLGTAIGSAGLAYALAVGSLYAFQRRLLFRPDRAAPVLPRDLEGRFRRAAAETADGLALALWYAPPAAAEAPVLLYFHGNDGNVGPRADKVRPYLARGMGVLLAGYRGYGGNPGRPSERGLYADARAARAFLDAQGIAAGRIVYYGESLGSGVAVQLATERAPRALVLEAPYTSVVDVAAARYPWVPVRLLMRDRFDSEAKIGRLAVPILVLHGALDRTTPVRFGERLAAAAPGAARAAIIAEAAHVDLYDFGAADLIAGFVEDPAASLPPPPLGMPA